MLRLRPRHLARMGLSTLSAAALAAGMLAAAAPAGAAVPAAAPSRHVMPTVHGAVRAPAVVRQLRYGGGVDGIGVTTGHEKVYVVFYGSQWGTVGSAGGYTTLSGDPRGMAPRLQAMYAGLGTSGELWSGVMTQFCQGVALHATSCPSGTVPHVAYPTGGGVLAGVWADEATASPGTATAFQLGTEAVRAAAHFGNTTAASNRNAQYIVVSPTGTHPDGFNTPGGGFCAWHDWNGDPFVGVTSPYGDLAFTNAPYVTDLGASCGQNYVNAGSAGTLDGVSIVMGHEYAETITDQNPAGGWTDSTGAENADKCAWIGVGGTGGAQNVAFSTGSFAMQGSWSNLDRGCRIAHAIVT